MGALGSNKIVWNRTAAPVRVSGQEGNVKQLSRVVWSEGMYLGPHHFQAQASFFENTLHFTSNALWFCPFGFAGYELDAEALRNGVVSLLHARGLFPDGIAFHIPDSDAAPEQRDIAEPFPPTRDRLIVLLGIPEYVPSGANCALNGAGGNRLRYTAVEKPLFDDNTGADEKPVRFARKNLRLMLETEDSAGYVTLPLARVRRDGAGGFVYDDEFIPPSLYIGASERLMMIARRLLDILQDKSTSLLGAARGTGKLQSGLSPQQVATFWFLHAINSAIAPLRHLCGTRMCHPEELFSEMLRLGGALCTFGLDSHPNQLPFYDHLNLEDSFGKLDKHIRAHLELIVPTNCVTIPLKPAGNYFWQGEVTDARCLGRSRWLVSVHSRIGEADLIRNSLQLIKVCSQKYIGELVRRAIPGLDMTHLSNPPAAASPKVEYQYFSINKSGPCWESIMKTKQVGVYIPGEIPSPDIELLVILD
jgi:type VI secretion system protein ImpJ